MTTKRPDMRAYFAARIDQHVNGMLARSIPRLPREVHNVEGDVTDSVITVHLHDGTEFEWSGGRYSSRKVNLCYAPLQPKPVNY